MRLNYVSAQLVVKNKLRTLLRNEFSIYQINFIIIPNIIIDVCMLLLCIIHSVYIYALCQPTAY